MTTLELRRYCGLEAGDDWPRRLAVDIASTDNKPIITNIIKSNLSALGYAESTCMHRHDGVSTYVFRRHKDEVLEQLIDSTIYQHRIEELEALVEEAMTLCDLHIDLLPWHQKAVKILQK